jgi:hypothetical protein
VNVGAEPLAGLGGPTALGGSYAVRLPPGKPSWGAARPTSACRLREVRMDDELHRPRRSLVK